MVASFLMVCFTLIKFLVQIRIFPYNGGHSREIYHTKRMQRFTSIFLSSFSPLVRILELFVLFFFSFFLNLPYFLSCRVFCVKFSCDASYVISGSDDTNLRIWKAKASEQLGVVRNLSLSPFRYLFDDIIVHVY